jgi:mono/diheme cytochrome c family protein
LQSGWTRSGARIAAALLAAAAVACGEARDPDAPPRDPLAVQGERVYQNVCIACHHGNPARDGALGPAIAGSSRALLEAKVLRGEYPPGYTPKRETAAMPRFEYLADDIPALEAYLAEAAEADAASS